MPSTPILTLLSQILLAPKPEYHGEITKTVNTPPKMAVMPINTEVPQGGVLS